MSQSIASADSGIDLSQFHQVFFEEAGENLERMEQLLLEVDIESADDEMLNSIFRCAHSVKGGAATFGFNDVAELTHQMESLLDKLRRHELDPSADMVDTLLRSGDALKAQLARHQSGSGDAVDTSELLSVFALFGAGKVATKPLTSVSAIAQTAQPDPAALAERRALELKVGPLDTMELADDLVSLFGEIPGLGTIEPLDGGHAAEGVRRFRVLTSSSDDDLLDLCCFHISRDKLQLMPLGADYGFHEGAPGAPEPSVDEAGFGFFDGAPGAPGISPAIADGSAEPSAAKAKSKAAAAAPAATEATTLRVSVEKVDQLINLVGELVITQAMLAQTSAKVDSAVYQQMAAGLADLDRNTRDLQESVMSIRMIPMSVVFNRFPRMLRDLASKLGKKVNFVTKGEATELDKGMIEKITDPLTHLVRNSCDHGIETPEQRIAKGKPEHGSITLAASHQGGGILIEVIDDGRGLNRDVLLRKARERGIETPDNLSNGDVWNLIFAPGFSTADVVTDVSGRGVGMDVVKKNITALGGTVEIESSEGYGMNVKVRLPLTLAIMDGMSVGVAEECYIIPLASVVESFLLQADMVKSIGGTGRVVQVRDEFLPVLDLESIFCVPRPTPRLGSSIVVVIEADGIRVALQVDELLGQQQVVVKNMEANYRRVNDVSGATIMGNGRVALILDVGALVRRGRP